MRWLPALLICLCGPLAVAQETSPPEAVWRSDFANPHDGVKLMHGVQRVSGSFGAALEFTSALQYAEVDFSRKLDGIQAATIGGWFFIRRRGEGCFLFRGTPQIAPRPLAVCQAVGERRPMEEENCAAVSEVYRALGANDGVKYWWVAGDHDFPPVARQAATAWFHRWLDR
jgi:hypothetical protein